MENKLSPIAVSAILTLKRKEYLAPHYIRVTLTGDDVPLFKDTTVGANNKIFLPASGESEIYFDPAKSIRRTYTHRGIDLEKNEMIVDFVVHGADQTTGHSAGQSIDHRSGPASAWAINAEPGARIGVAMKNKAMELYPPADWYLLVADASGLPVIATILETVPINARGVAFIEVLNADEEIPLVTASRIDVRWIHNDAPGEKKPLVDVVKSTEFPDQMSTKLFGYIAAEYSSVKDIRIFLREEKGWKNEHFFAYSYWKYGKSEDRSVQERQEEKQSEPNVP